MSHTQWRTGRSLGRTLYLRTGGDDYQADTFVGVLDTRELATQVVAAMNERADLYAQIQAVPHGPGCPGGEGCWCPVHEVLALLAGSGA